MTKKVKLELIGLNGNAYSLVGAFQRAARRQGWEQEQIKSVLDDCMSGDYDHLLQVLMKNTEPPQSEDDEETEVA